MADVAAAPAVPVKQEPVPQGNNSAAATSNGAPNGNAGGNQGGNKTRRGNFRGGRGGAGGNMNRTFNNRGQNPQNQNRGGFQNKQNNAPKPNEVSFLFHKMADDASISFLVICPTTPRSPSEKLPPLESAVVVNERNCNRVEESSVTAWCWVSNPTILLRLDDNYLMIK